jgi:tetratricopeptide (TPR) repeat protein
MKKISLLIFCFGFQAITPIFAQSEPDDIAVVTDDFQNSFYESIKQKGIENYDKAIESLEKCLKLQPENAVILHEMGKNYLLLKDFKLAYDSFEKASNIDPKNRWYFHGMYDVCYQTQDWMKAIEIVQKLIVFDLGYREDIVSLYMKTQQFDKALVMINELNATAGKSEKRELYKSQILNNPANQGAEIKNLLAEIAKNPKEESNYNALILLYTKSNQDKEAQKIWDKLEVEIPNSDWTQINVFKKSIMANEGEKAVFAMNQVLQSNKIDSKIKHRILNEFLIFTKNNPKFDPDLEKAVGYFKNDSSVKVAKEIGKFFQIKQNWAKAIQYYELDAKTNASDLETSSLLMECYAQSNLFEVLSKKADAVAELFPLQPEPYLYAGLANNQLKNFKKAKEMLQTGLDYLVDNKNLEYKFYTQLVITFTGLGDTKNKDEAQLKANKINIKQ